MSNLSPRAVSWAVQSRTHLEPKKGQPSGGDRARVPACKTARDEIGWQGPTTGETASSYNQLYTIVTHPAFRLGFLDAQNGQPLEHDKIRERIIGETPPRAFERMNIDPESLSVEIAQYRYEEGRIAVIQEGLRCKAWGHPDFPPASIRTYIWNRADKTPRTGPKSAEPSPSIVASMRGGGLPLFAERRAV